MANAEKICSTSSRPHLGHSGVFALRAQDELLEDVAAIRAGVFKQGHGELFTTYARRSRSFLA